MNTLIELALNTRKGMKESSMDDWLIDAIMEFYSIIKAGHVLKTTNVFVGGHEKKTYNF